MRVASVLFNVPSVSPSYLAALPLSLGLRPLFLHNASCRYAFKFYCNKKKLVPRWDLGRVLGISNPTTVRETAPPAPQPVLPSWRQHHPRSLILAAQCDLSALPGSMTASVQGFSAAVCQGRFTTPPRPPCPPPRLGAGHCSAVPMIRGWRGFSSLESRSPNARRREDLFALSVQRRPQQHLDGPSTHISSSAILGRQCGLGGSATDGHADTA